MSKLLTLTIDVGNGTLIRDVQLWDMDGEEQRNGKTYQCKVMGTIDMKRLPLWVRKGKEYTCFSHSNSTGSYFRSRLAKRRHADRAVVLELPNEALGHELAVLYRTISHGLLSVKCSALDFSMRQVLDRQLHDAWEVSTEGPRDRSIDAIVARKQRQRTASTIRVSTSMRVAEYKRQFSARLSGCILGALRLRGLEKEPEFHQIYKMTFASAEFAFRRELSESRDPVAFETIQETVETLMKLFTKS
ncbi:LAMI_0H09626g1_1 [Lachancea mirantina]|uniref:Mitochondrial morphogenesis protein SLD7 n=1 Tax=Lachancea mirantina TaxID=1230905 RepID=A0A1G4KGX9_9SACH|nr:LAMI_0H09626g1_1 [Lachancea mirantina]